MPEYGADFYAYLDSFAGCSARRIIPLVTDAMPVASVADFGCGQGAWLQVWSGTGAEIMGTDGDYVDRSRPPTASASTSCARCRARPWTGWQP